MPGHAVDVENIGHLNSTRRDSFVARSPTMDTSWSYLHNPQMWIVIFLSWQVTCSYGTPMKSACLYHCLYADQSISISPYPTRFDISYLSSPYTYCTFSVVNIIAALFSISFFFKTRISHGRLTNVKFMEPVLKQLFIVTVETLFARSSKTNYCRGKCRPKAEFESFFYSKDFVPIYDFRNKLLLLEWIMNLWR